MKKIFSLCLVLVMLLIQLTTAVTVAKTGDIAGYAKYTDICAYINHYPITSYNINGYTAVVAEDLRNYGFAVEWNGNDRTLSVTRDNNATGIAPYGTVYKYASMAGKNSFPYLETDIVTYVNGAKVESFNISGSTCIYIDSLAAFGEVSWEPEIRAIKVWIDGLPVKEYAPPEEFTVRMYALDGRSISVVGGDAEAYKAVGWYEYPVTEIITAGGQSRVERVNPEAYAAYKNILDKSFAGIMDDADFYNMYTSNAQRNAGVDKTLYAYLFDITGDGKEELFLKEATNVKSDAMLDKAVCKEWIRVFTYEENGVRRIGQSLTWAKNEGASKYGGNTYSFYEPAGYIGSIISSAEFPHISDNCLYYCLGTDGKQYLADNMTQYTHEEIRFSFYAYNGSHMEKVCTLESNFVPSWYISSSLHSDRGSYLFKINGETVSEEAYRQCLIKYTGGGSYKLVNNDCSTVSGKLATVAE